MPPEPGKELAPRTTDEWLAAQTGVTIFRTPEGRTAISFEPNFAQRFNFLAPISQVTQLDNNWKPDPRMVRLDPEKHCYKRKGKWDLSKQGLLLLANLAGIDKDGDPVWSDLPGGAGFRVTVRAKQRKSDGTYRRDSGTITIVWRRAEAKIRRESEDKPPAVIEARVDEWYEAIHQKSETRAYLRAIRNLLSLPGEFTAAELKRPFFVIGYVFVPDWSNPNVSKLLALQFREGTHDLFEGDVVEEEIRSTPALPTGSIQEEELDGGWSEADEGAGEDEGDGEGESAIEGSVAEPPDWDDDWPPYDFDEGALIGDELGDEVGAAPSEFRKPERSFAPANGKYKNIDVEEIVRSADGRVWLAAAAKRRTDPVAKQLALDWLSYALQREVTIETLETGEVA